MDFNPFGLSPFQAVFLTCFICFFVGVCWLLTCLTTFYMTKLICQTVIDSWHELQVVVMTITTAWQGKKSPDSKP